MRIVAIILFVPRDIDATKGTKPPINVPTTGISWERIPAATPNAIADGRPTNRKPIDNTKLAKTPRINFATVKPAAFDTPTFQTSSIIFQNELDKLFLNAALHLFPSLIK